MTFYERISILLFYAKSRYRVLWQFLYKIIILEILCIYYLCRTTIIVLRLTYIFMHPDLINIPKYFYEIIFMSKLFCANIKC